MFSQGLPLFENYDAFMVTGQQNKIICNREGILPMSIGLSGLDTPCCLQPVTIEVSPTHPLIQLARVIPWQALADMVLPDLKRTTPKGKWWLGRKLTLRIHLGAFLLQWLYNLTDRQVEWALKDNAAYQLLCGRGLIDPWHAPDHTKIEEFRSRLSPETQRQVANVVAVWATELGFADPSAMDIDSTVQEANIAYPSDAHLMVKMTLLVHKVWTYMKQNIAFFADFLPCVDVKAVKAKARAFYVAAVVKLSCLFFSPRYFLDTVSHRAEPPYGFLWRAALPLPMPLYRFGFSNRSIPADRFLGAERRENLRLMMRKRGCSPPWPDG